MTNTMDHLGQTDEDVFAPKYSDEDLEAAVGNPQTFPTFTCSQPMCATGDGRRLRHLAGKLTAATFSK